MSEHDKQDEQQEPDNVPAQVAGTEPEAPEAKPEPPAKSRSVLAVFAFLLALIALAASGWVYQELQKTLASTGIEEKAAQTEKQLRAAVETQLRAQEKQQRQAMEALRREMQAAVSTAANIEQTLNARMVEQSRDISSRISLSERKQLGLEQSVEQLTQQLMAARAKLNSMSSSERSQWLLAECEYLLRLANQRLLISKDFAGAADMLRAADSILLELDDAGLNGVRQEMAKEVAALETASQFDVEGLYFKLESLANQAEKLDLYEMPGMEQDAEPAPLEGDWQSRAMQGIERAWEKLSGYIRFTSRNPHYERLIDPEQEAALRYSVRLMFEQAQLALMSGRQELYRRSMQRAADTIGKYYAIDEPVARLVGKVEALVDEKVITQTPDISGSLRALKLYMETIYRPQQAAQERG